MAKCQVLKSGATRNEQQATRYYLSNKASSSPSHVPLLRVAVFSSQKLTEKFSGSVAPDSQVLEDSFFRDSLRANPECPAAIALYPFEDTSFAE
jgi:hypothetical protein